MNNLSAMLVDAADLIEARVAADTEVREQLDELSKHDKEPQLSRRLDNGYVLQIRLVRAK